jgi:predicted YcjX-like family ATPase
MVRGAGGKKWDSLPRLREMLTNPQGQSRLLGIEIEPSGVGLIPRFPYEAFRDVLATGNGQGWPRSTEKPALITLRLLVQPGSMLRAMLGPRVVRLELLDYPGEWLVDLPLLEQSYHAWSAETLLHLREPPRASMAEEFLRFIATLSPNAPANEATELHGFRLYSAALARCRKEAGLRWLQPGRFLMPDAWQDAPFMHFFPWESARSPLPGTLGAQLRDRFDVYKSEMRKDFFERHFSAFNRQVVLVDVLGALFAGRTAFEDTRKALGSIGASYARLLEGGWFGRRIERVAFAATKADHVDDLQRDNLRLTLQHMVESASGSAKPISHRSFHVISSIRCTVDDNVTDSDGRVKRVVKGVKLGGTVQQPFSAGFVPAGAVPNSFWSQPYFEMPKLQPPAFQGGDTFPIEHLNLDSLLVELLGDAL